MIGEYPLIVSIIIQSFAGTMHKCGGVLRNAQTAITSACCVYGEDATKITIKCGSLDRNHMPRTSPVSSITFYHLFIPETTSSPGSTMISIVGWGRTNDDGKGVCVEDEGGPVMYNNQLMGILSQGSCGAPDVQNVYTSTIAVLDFLNSS
ncbi:trypsin-like cysteine/serine peptidase domain-containing protein [Cunninghamella echinulata]|nr:trypsin-like cysteine/serine peptidase domain-containing protein [Cunninghamella echinulata]